MTIHAFVDESIRRDRYILCAVLIPGEQLHQARVLVRGFCLPGQRRWHFNDESEQRQRQIIAAMARCRGVAVAIYKGRGPEVGVRHECMTELVTDLVDIKANWLVVESRESQDQRDRHSIASVLRKTSAELQYAQCHRIPNLACGGQTQRIGLSVPAASGRRRSRRLFD